MGLFDKKESAPQPLPLTPEAAAAVVAGEHGGVDVPPAVQAEVAEALRIALTAKYPTDGSVPPGTKSDSAKLRWSLLPWRGAQRVVEVLEHGAKKYAPHNWRAVPDARARYNEAFIRHVVAIQQGEVNDKDSGLPHLAHAACCALFLLEIDS